MGGQAGDFSPRKKVKVTYFHSVPLDYPPMFLLWQSSCCDIRRFQACCSVKSSKNVVNPRERARPAYSSAGRLRLNPGAPSRQTGPAIRTHTRFVHDSKASAHIPDFRQQPLSGSTHIPDFRQQPLSGSFWVKVSMSGLWS